MLALKFVQVKQNSMGCQCQLCKQPTLFVLHAEKIKQFQNPTNLVLFNLASTVPYGRCSIHSEIGSFKDHFETSSWHWIISCTYPCTCNTLQCTCIKNNMLLAASIRRVKILLSTWKKTETWTLLPKSGTNFQVFP